MAPKGAPKPDGAFVDLPDRGIKMYYETSGPNRAEFQGENERVLFMILGSAADLRKTADQQYINQSAGMFKVLTYDHRNTGQTTIKDEPCTMEDYADDAAALLQAVVPEKLPIFVIGISFGGMVAQHLAIRHPHLISKLVLCCCATGGAGGMSFPIHEWYAPGHTMEDRVVKKIFQANTDRNEEWKVKSPTEWQMTVAVLTRDEKVGVNDPLRMEGTLRQMEARKSHDSWDKIGQLADMDVLVCGSHKDNITPVDLMKNMVKRIGGKVESKLDFDWGHAFIAADTTAMPYVNEFLRRPSGASAGSKQIWKVVGGADKGGILVRSGEELSSPQLDARLATNSLVEQLAVKGDRLHFKLLKGGGPSEGWVAVKLKDGKELAVKTDEKP